MANVEALSSNFPSGVVSNLRSPSVRIVMRWFPLMIWEEEGATGLILRVGKSDIVRTGSRSERNEVEKRREKRERVVGYMLIFIWPVGGRGIFGDQGDCTR